MQLVKPDDPILRQVCRADFTITGDQMFYLLAEPDGLPAGKQDDLEGFAFHRVVTYACDMSTESRMYAKTKTWNPFMGCRFDCTYCKPTFKQQAKRQKHNCVQCYDYLPHYHEKRLKTIPSKEIVFVCGDADISFCEPAFTRRIIDRIKQHSKRCPHKTFYFQSKRPAYFAQFLPEFPENVILLTTLETNRDQPAVSKAPVPSERYRQFKSLDYPRKAVTIEPVMDFDLDVFARWIRELRVEYVWLGFNSQPQSVKLPEPAPEKVQRFVSLLAGADIEVRGKELRGLVLPTG